MATIIAFSNYSNSCKKHAVSTNNNSNDVLPAVFSSTRNSRASCTISSSCLSHAVVVVVSRSRRGGNIRHNCTSKIIISGCRSVMTVPDIKHNVALYLSFYLTLYLTYIAFIQPCLTTTIFFVCFFHGDLPEKAAS